MIKAKVVTPNGIYKQFDTPFINITSKDGERGILPNHVPVVFMLDIGKMETSENNEKKVYAISGGMFYFENKQANIIVNSIEVKEDIDVNRALASKERQLEKLEKKDPNMDLKRAQVALKRALNRIEIAS